MAKKKGKITYNIDNINLEIDYDRLADAMVNAQKKADAHEKKANSFRSLLMSGFNSLMSLAAVCLIGVITSGLWLAEMHVAVKTIGIVFCVSCMVLIIMSMFESFSDSNEDVLTYFNANIGLIALIIALLALIKEV